MTDRKDRFAGCLLGVLVGDGMGVRVQGLERRLVEQRFADSDSLRVLSPGPYGAATLMTLALASSVVAAGGAFAAEDFARRLADTYDGDRGYGRGTERVLERLCNGEAWQRAAAGPGGRASFGNGAATRSAPLGLAFAGDVDRLRWTAEQAAAVTHGHVLAIEGAVLQALAVAMALQAAGRPIDAEGFLRSLALQCRTREFAARMRTAAELVGRKNLRRAVLVERLGNAPTALGSVATAAFCFARHANSFEDSIVEALGLGGASCSITSMTGAIAGAYLGDGSIPERWLETCGDTVLSLSEVHSVAEGLVGFVESSAACG